MQNNYLYVGVIVIERVCDDDGDDLLISIFKFSPTII